MSTHDAIVIGAGPNGLVAANHLADAGWDVLVLEAQEEVGGAVRSGRDVHPDFVHDTFSAFYPLAAGSPTIASFCLERYGLRWRHAPAVLGHPDRDGQWNILHRDRHLTAARLEARSPGDGDAWLRLCAEWDIVGTHLVGTLLSPVPPIKHTPGLLAAVRRAGGLPLVKDMATSVIELGRHRFSAEGARLLLAGNSGHSDISLHASGSGLLGVMMTMLGQTVGFPVPEGGAGALTRALARRFEALGGDLRCGQDVTTIDVRGGRAVAVRTADAERHEARRAVIATVVAPHLYGRLLAPEDVPSSTLKAMKSFTWDPGTVKVDWALSGPVPWATPPPEAPGTVHLADSVEEMSEALDQVATGGIPADPFLVVGQMTSTDSSRSPAGTESLWAYTHVPRRVSRDVGREQIRGVWDYDDKERFAERITARIERFAPGFSERILARRVLGPHDMEARDANLVGGSINGGTSQLHQQLVFRPVPGHGRAETGIAGLYLGSASAHPGGGVHGAPGMNAARAAVAHDRIQRGLDAGRRVIRHVTNRP